jgi:four helix bundle protein
MKDFRRLKVWEKGHQLTLGVYKSTAAFPKEERYGLSAQLRRASASVPANIAEGCGRSGNREMARFLQMGMGSLRELEYHLLLAQDLGYLDRDTYSGLQGSVAELEKMLAALIRRVRADNAPTSRMVKPMTGRSQVPGEQS